MIGRRRYHFQLLFVLFLFVFLSKHRGGFALAQQEDEGDVGAFDDDDDDDDGLFQTNPDFVEYDDSDEDDEDEEDGEEEADGKSQVEKKLRVKKSKLKSVFRAFRRNRSKIIFALVLFAFRREIWKIVYHFLSEPEVVTDPNTGETYRARRISVRPTSVLKILLFVYFIRKFQDTHGSSTIPPGAAVVMGPQFILLSDLLSLVAPMNPAYVPPTEQHWTFEQLNERYTVDSMALDKAMKVEAQTTLSTNATTLSSFMKERLGRVPHGSTLRKKGHGTVIVVEMRNLGTAVSTMSSIRDQVSFIISQHRANQTRLETNNSTETAKLEVVIDLESPGGGVSDYGQAAQHLLRLRNEPGIDLTICVDNVAASGGYMMACTATPGRLFAAPFAMVGSIGAYIQAVNIHKALDDRGVQSIIFRAGKNKAPVGLLGEITEAGKANLQHRLETTQVAFKNHVTSARPILEDSIDEIATGDVWLGCEAVKNGLVDRLVTSDEYIQDRIRTGATVLKLIRFEKPSIFGKRNSYGSRLQAFVRSVVKEARAAFWDGTGLDSESLNARSFTAKAVQAAKS